MFRKSILSLSKHRISFKSCFNSNNHNNNLFKTFSTTTNRISNNNNSKSVSNALDYKTLFEENLSNLENNSKLNNSNSLSNHSNHSTIYHNKLSGQLSNVSFLIEKFDSKLENGQKNDSNESFNLIGRVLSKRARYFKMIFHFFCFENERFLNSGALSLSLSLLLVVQNYYF
jgi:hypothetical protein